jgi:hypothetical protein
MLVTERITDEGLLQILREVREAPRVGVVELDQFGESLEKFERALSDLRWGVSGVVSEGDLKLEFSKFGSRWVLLANGQKLRNVRLEQRLQCVQLFPRLLEVMAEAVTRKSLDLQEKIQEVEGYVTLLQQYSTNPSER